MAKRKARYKTKKSWIDPPWAKEPRLTERMERTVRYHMGRRMIMKTQMERFAYDSGMMDALELMARPWYNPRQVGRILQIYGENAGRIDREGLDYHTMELE